MSLFLENQIPQKTVDIRTSWAFETLSNSQQKRALKEERGALPSNRLLGWFFIHPCLIESPTMHDK